MSHGSESLEYNCFYHLPLYMPDLPVTFWVMRIGTSLSFSRAIKGSLLLRRLVKVRLYFIWRALVWCWRPTCWTGSDWSVEDACVPWTWVGTMNHTAESGLLWHRGKWAFYDIVGRRFLHFFSHIHLRACLLRSYQVWKQKLTHGHLYYFLNETGVCCFNVSPHKRILSLCTFIGTMRLISPIKLNVIHVYI